MSGEMEKRVPDVLWIAIVSLVLMICAKVVFLYRVGPVILIDAALSVVLLFGIVRGQRWAYVLTIVFVALGTLTTLSKGVSQAAAVLLLDCLVLVPVLLCREYFFPTMSGQQDNSAAGRS